MLRKVDFIPYLTTISQLTMPAPNMTFWMMLPITYYKSMVEICVQHQAMFLGQ